jgi:hypothetical protein
MMTLTTLQQAVVEANQPSFLQGPAGTGKTITLQRRLSHLLQSGEPAYTILVLVAEPEHTSAFLDAVHQTAPGAYADLQITTYTNLAREMLTLFWPLLARPAGFVHAHRPPTFLSYDLAQLLMWQTLDPMLADGALANLRLRPQQIVSQILDTLNRAALNGLTLEHAIDRQQSTWSGEPEHLGHLRDAAAAAHTFRRTCLNNNLVDLSLVVQVFDRHLIQHPEFYRYFSERFRHLIVDNIEEQTPAGQNFVASLMDATETTTIAYDSDGGYKRFLAADPAGAKRFADRFPQPLELNQSFITNPALVHLANLVENHLLNTHHPTGEASKAILSAIGGRYRREMVAGLIETLAGFQASRTVRPQDIAIITPYLDGALRHSLTSGLQEAGIPYFLHRRRSSPRDEPRIRAWLTWLALAHPHWAVPPSTFDVAEALTLSVAGLDPARAQLLAENLYRPSEPMLQPVDHLTDRVRQRVDGELIELVEELRQWLDENGRDQLPLDVFLHRLFNDLLGERRFQPEPDLAGAAVCDWLVRTAGRLRQSAAPLGYQTPEAVGRALINGIQQGLVTADPPELGDPPDPDGVMVSTVYGYLLAGRPVAVQVWLETAATGWWDIPRQPLSNAFVLARDWSPDRLWTMDEDYRIRNELLSRIIRGLTARCRQGVILANSDLDRRGIRQDGPLWRALQPAR